MIWSLGDTLRLIENYLPGELIPPQAFSNIKEVAKFLPDAMSSFILECRLGKDAPRVDFSGCVIVAEGGRDNLVGDSSILESPLGGCIGEFYIHWADTKSPLYENVSLIWLEFDIVDSQKIESPIPSLFFCLKELRSVDSTVPVHKADAKKTQQVTEFALKTLLGNPVPSKLNQNLSLCFNSIPVEGQVAHIGIMLSRGSDSIRVCAEIPKDQVLEYLSHVGWSGSINEVKNIVSTFSPCVKRIHITLDVGDSIFPNIGIEFIFNTLPEIEPGLPLFLNLLIDEKMCTPEKRDALLTWPGYSLEIYPNDSWPSILWRRLSHIKITCQPGSSLSAKAYLWFSPRFGLF